MKKIFVTGINGLLGTNLVNDLMEQGFEVRGLIRNKSKFQGRLHPDLELIQGDLFIDHTELLQDVDAVIHIAAETNQGLIHYSDYWKINYNASVQLFNAAIQCKVTKFIFISTANTIGFGSISDLGNELKEIMFPFSASFYAQSKLKTENYLLQNNDKIEVIILNPTFMLGAFDTNPGSGRIILMGWKRKIIFYPPGGKNFVHVKDVSQSIINSLYKGKNGEKYLVANENLIYSDFFRKLTKLTNRKPVMVKIPKPFLLAMGYVGNVFRKLNIRTEIHSVNMKILCINNFYSNQKSVTELEIQYRPIDSAINDAINYFKTKNSNAYKQ